MILKEINDKCVQFNIPAINLEGLDDEAHIKRMIESFFTLASQPYFEYKLSANIRRALIRRKILKPRSQSKGKEMALLIIELLK